eukprot:GILK01012633.1.p3 GENE.GILK01012633.1~~GILK01012633.1.p3  ORF type:complete len:128 (-),score=11.35 GILK01012633.1:1734-2117(-)
MDTMASSASINNAPLPAQKGTLATMELVCVRLVGKGHNVPKLCVPFLANRMEYVGMVVAYAIMDTVASGAISESEIRVTALATEAVSMVSVYVLLGIQECAARISNQHVRVTILMRSHNARLLTTKH